MTFSGREFHLQPVPYSFGSGQFLTLYVTAYNGIENKGSSGIFTIPINPGPTGGSMSVSPTSGTATSTKFTITTSGWTDSDLPLKYNFTALILPNKTLELASLSTSTTITTTLPQNVSIIAIFCLDSFLNPSEPTWVNVTVTPNNNVSSIVENVNDVLNTLSGTPQEKVNILTNLQTQLSDLDTNVTSTTCATGCSGHGRCGKRNRCICNQGWTLSDCSKSTNEFNTVMETKMKLLDSVPANVANDPVLKSSVL